MHDFAGIGLLVGRVRDTSTVLHKIVCKILTTKHTKHTKTENASLSLVSASFFVSFACFVVKMLTTTFRVVRLNPERGAPGRTAIC